MDYKITCYSNYKNKIYNLFADFIEKYNNLPTIYTMQNQWMSRREATYDKEYYLLS